VQFDRYIGQTPIKSVHFPRSNKNSKMSNHDQDHFFLKGEKPRCLAGDFPLKGRKFPLT
jgi:hypothetical protein